MGKVMHRLILLCLCVGLSYSVQGWARDYDLTDTDEAHALYLKAKDALAEGRLVDAERLAKQAIALVDVHGQIPLKAIPMKRYIREKRQTVTTIAGTYVNYYPRQILADVEKGYKAVADIEKLRMKQAEPPKLNIVITLLDQSGDGELQAYESGTVRISLKNVGKGLAEDTELRVSIGDFVTTTEFNMGDVALGQKVEQDLTFKVPKDIDNGRINIVAKVTEKDGFSAQERIRVRSQSMLPPRLQIVPHLEFSEDIIPGRDARTMFMVTNIGSQPIFNVSIKGVPNDNKTLRIHDISSESIPMLQPGKSTSFALRFAVTEAAEPGMTLPLFVQVNSAGFEGEYINPRLVVSQTQYQHNAQWASLKQAQQQSRTVLVPDTKTFVLCMQTRIAANSDNCMGLQGNIFNHWVALGHGFESVDMEVTELQSYIRALKGMLVNNEYKHLLIYIAGEGEVLGHDLYLSQSQNHPLSKVAQLLNQIFSGKITLWLEMSFAPRPSVLPMTAVVTMKEDIADNFSVLVATQPMQINQRDAGMNQGVFTDALQTFFGQERQLITSSELMQEFVTFFNSTYSQTLTQMQTPWYVHSTDSGEPDVHFRLEERL